MASKRGSMDKIAIFYHLFQAPTWEMMYNDQMSILIDTGLMDAAEFVHVGINGSTDPVYKNRKIQHHFNPNPEREETDTLRSLLEFSQNNDGYKILYFHTKGISYSSAAFSAPNPIVKCIYDWRKMMEYYAIKHWKDCISILDRFDAVGPLLRPAPRLHYSGGYWWSKPEYIRTLDHGLLDTPDRYDREFWIGSGPGMYANLHESGIVHYHSEYPESAWSPIPLELLAGEPPSGN